MTDRAIVISGAARGLGRAQALAAAELGAHVYVTDVADGRGVADEIRAAGGSASFHHQDIREEASWHSLLKQIADDGRVPHGLVNNAGVTFRHGFAGTSAEDWRRIIEINLTGAFLGIRAFAPVMAEAGGGSIVNIASGAGVMGYFSPAYAASKWGLIGLSKSAAGEWADRGVRVNAVLPGVIAVERHVGSDPFVAATVASVPAGRAGRPDEVARAVKFLLSDEASYVSGAEWLVDGAWTSNGLHKQIIDRYSADV
jgi:NAD(P)-dependent dehydrogenase (short-subunit alcohol dehydrogenase family)